MSTGGATVVVVNASSGPSGLYDSRKRRFLRFMRSCMADNSRRDSRPYSPAPDSDRALIAPRLRHRTPSAWMRFCTHLWPPPKVAAFRCTVWQHNFALGGSITLHRVAELIAFSIRSSYPYRAGASSVPASFYQRMRKETLLEPTEIAIRQAELILKLYELRREPVMRQARSYIGGPFLPASADELVALVTSGKQESAYILQVYGYWDMVAAFALHGALDPALLYDVCQEMYFQYAKIQPYLEGFRKRMNLPEWMRNIERVVDGSMDGQARLETMRRNVEEIASLRKVQPEG
jgi:hypothetical protein